MDDEDSQDELINRNVSHGKGKRPNTSIVSDEEEYAEDSHEHSTDSEDDASQDGEDEGGEEEEEEDDSEDGVKEPEDVTGTEPADFGLSSDEDAEKCPICLNSFHEQPVATPQNCEHYFCLDCILEWAKNANSCPVDRRVFTNILLRKCYGGKVQKTITIQRPATQEQEEQMNVDLEQTSCEVCGGTDREDRLLLCDGCDAGYHMECLTPPLDAVPVEEWFCPECAPNNHNRRPDEFSEEISVLPTTSRSPPSGSRPTRAIARTQHSERVRANVNRHRITQARTAAQLVPQMQSTWLDETINAVVAGLNTAMYVRDLTPRLRARRRRKRAPKKKTVKEGKDIKGKTSTTKVNRHKRKVRRKKFRKKAVVKKKSTSQGRIAQSLGIKNPSRGSAAPSVYQSSMRSDIVAPPLYIFGNPFEIDPVDNGDEEMEEAPVQPSLLEAKRRGLSRSALRSHQPVARPILAGLSRGGPSIPQLEEIVEAAPDPDLLGSILSAQSLLLMDSSDVVISRDGSLKARKSASLERTPSVGTADSHSSSPLRNSSQSSLQPTTTPVTPSTCCPATSHAPAPVLDHPRLSTPLLHKSSPANTTGTGHHHWGSGSIRDQPPARLTNAAPDSHLGERRNTTNVIAKKPPPKPAWVDVSVLPRIPKIKRDNSSVAHGSTGNNSSNFPESSMTSLTGDKGHQNSVDQQRTSENRQGRPADSQSQRPYSAVPSSSFSNSFSTPSTSASVTSNSQPSSSSAISFRISSNRNPWHIRRLSEPNQTLASKDKNSVKRNQKDKEMLLSSFSCTKKNSVESEVYDPFNPTGSDASDSEKENENDKRESSLQTLPPRLQTVGQIEDVKHEMKTESMDEDEIKTESMDEDEIKTESMDLDLPVENEMSGIKVQVKKEPASPKDDPWSSPSHQPAFLLPAQSESLSTLVVSSGNPVVSDEEDRGNSEAHLTADLDHSRSSSLSSHHSDQEGKMEVKSEPDVEPSPAKLTSPVVPQVTKGNGFIHEVSSVSGNSGINHRGKEKEIPQSPCASSGEEKRSQCASSSPPYKASDQADKQKKHSRSRDRRRSHSRSPRRRRSRSRSREQSRVQDRRRSTRSSSSESSRKRKRRHDSRDRYDSRENEGQKRYKRKRYHHSRSRSRSMSRSRSRSRERRRERTFSHRSSRSRDRHEIRSKRKKSRSTSRDRRRRDNISEGTRYRERHSQKSVSSVSTEEKDQNCSPDRNSLLPKGLQTEQSECDATVSGTAIKKEIDFCSQENSQLPEQPGEQILEDVLSISVSHESYELKPVEIKEDKLENEKEYLSSKESQLLNYQPSNQVKVEQIWPDDEDSSSDDDALVINLSSPGPAPTDSEKMTDSEPASLSMVPKEEMKVEPLQESCQLKQEPVDSSDEEINVDYLIDNLDFIKKEMKDEPETGGSEEAKVIMDKESAEVKQEMESVLVMAGTKAKSQGKRVTWNIQEPVVSQPDKMSKLALFKLKLKQEGSRKAASSSSMQITSQGVTAVQGGSKSVAVSSPTLEERSNAGQGKSKSHNEELLQNSDQKDKYLKKLHMQERAIEEVKLAIKPFYQKRDITKEEYKEILRKAVQKVCHSKSGEINPVKVANLVKAYVDKYKHARKHRKAEDKQTAETPQEFRDSKDTA